MATAAPADTAARRGSLAAWIAERPRLIVSLIMLLSLAALLQLVDFREQRLRLTVDASLDPMIAPNLPAQPVDDVVHARFGAPTTPCWCCCKPPTCIPRRCCANSMN